MKSSGMRDSGTAQVELTASDETNSMSDDKSSSLSSMEAQERADAEETKEVQPIQLGRGSKSVANPGLNKESSLTQVPEE